jgi:hypothetical protein
MNTVKSRFNINGAGLFSYQNKKEKNKNKR